MIDMWQYEKKHFSEGFSYVCGVDEAGRGPLAGPVCAAAVILPTNVEIAGLNDSKKLSDKKRRELFPIICEKAIAFGIAFADHREIDEFNILQATYLAMERAIGNLDQKPDFLLVDGNRAKDFGIPLETVVGGDGLSASIAAASILAKVTRDDYMVEQSKIYPQYGFEVHKGYGTKVHYEALTKYGSCPIHRDSFLKSYYGKK